MLEFLALAQECAPTVAPQTMAAVVSVESSFNPYAIGVVGGRLKRQPTTQEEAVATAQALEADGWNFSMGLAQVNRYNLPKYELTYEQAFEPCDSLRVGSKILEDCYTRAVPKFETSDAALQAAFSCYYSGNYTRGFKADKAGGPSYVQKVLAQADVSPLAIEVVPNVKGVKPMYDKAASATPANAKTASTAPSAAQPSVKTPSGPPADHTPVLLQRSQNQPVSVRPVVTESDAGQRESVTNDSQPTNESATSSAIVF